MAGMNANTLIIYASRHGCAEKCARDLAGRLRGSVETIALGKGKPGNLAAYDTVVVGGSIRAGKIQKSVRAFCDRNLETLKGKRFGLFLCCMEEGEKADRQFADAFPAELIARATAKGLFGGEFDFKKMGWLERAIVRKVAKIDASVSKIKSEAVAVFAAAMNE